MTSLHAVTTQSFLAILVWLASAAPIAYAQSSLDVPPEFQIRLVEAARMADSGYLSTAVIEGIVDRPDLVGPIISLATGLAPDSADAVKQSAVNAFPGFAEQIVSAEPRAVVADREAASDVAVSSAMTDQSGDWIWSGEIDIGGSQSSGNSETQAANLGVELTARIGRWQQDIGTTFDFARDDGETTTRRLLADSKTRYDTSDRLYAFVFAEYEDDRFSGFSFRTTESAGLGYHLIDTDRLAITVEAGPGARQSKIRGADRVDNEILARLNSALTYDLSNSAQFRNDTDMFIGSNNNTMRNLSALRLEIIESWKIKLSFEVRYDDNPPLDTVSTDYQTKLSLAHTF